MTTSVHTTCGAAARTRTVTARAAILAAVLYLVQPFIVALGGLSGAEDADFLRPDQVRDLWWSGALQSMVLLGVGVALLVVVLGMQRLVREQLGRSLMEQVANTLGVIGATGWLFGASVGVASYSTVAAYMRKTEASIPSQEAALHMANVMTVAGLVLAATGLSVWLVWVARVGREAAIIGRALSAACVVVAVVIGATTLYGFPFGLLLLIPLLPFVGGSLLRGRPAEDAQDAQFPTT